jgi:UDP-glucose 4-epimerase
VKKVLVTGGAGYIGSHICVELAAHGYLPIVVDNFCASDRRVIERTQRVAGLAYPVHELDCRNTEALRGVFAAESEIFGVIHLAAHKSVGVSVQEPREYYDNNLGSLLSVLAAMTGAGVDRLVFSSSCTVYGQPKQVPVTEQSPIERAESPYGRTKQMCEAILEDVVASGAPLRGVTLRYFNPVGAHPSGLIGELPLGKPETLVPYITQTAAGHRDVLTVFGSDYPTRDGTCVRDYLHIVDLAAAHVAALAWLEQRSEGPFNQIFNLGTGAGVSVLEAIRAFEQASGVALRYRLGPRRPGDAAEVYANAEKAQRVLGWRARLGVLDAMRDAWRWQQNIQPAPGAF